MRLQKKPLLDCEKEKAPQLRERRVFGLRGSSRNKIIKIFYNNYFSFS
jgi:hypothetical protein